MHLFRSKLVNILFESLLNKNRTFSVYLFAIKFFFVLFPMFLQIVCIKISTIGNWNELYQSELLPTDENVSIHSDMFKELYKGGSLESLL